MRFQQPRNSPPKPGIRAGLRRRGGDVFHAAMAGAGFLGTREIPAPYEHVAVCLYGKFRFCVECIRPVKGGNAVHGRGRIEIGGFAEVALRAVEDFGACRERNPLRDWERAARGGGYGAPDSGGIGRFRAHARKAGGIFAPKRAQRAGKTRRRGNIAGSLRIPNPMPFFCYMSARRINQFARGAIYSGRDSNPYGQRPADFKSAASTIPPPEPNCLFYGAPPAFRTSGFLKCEYSKNPPQIKAFLARRRPGLSDSPAFFALKAFRNFVRVRKIPTIAHGK